MKNITTSRICRLTIICFLVLSLTAYLPAQQQSSPQSGIQGDSLMRQGIDQAEQRNYAAAAVNYAQACDAGTALGCQYLGVLYFNGDLGIPRDHVQAAKSFRKACDGGFGGGCKLLSEMYSNGSGVTKDPVRAAQLAQKASQLPSNDPFADAQVEKEVEKDAQGCKSGDGKACMNLAADYEQGSGVPKDYSRAELIEQQACDNRYGTACVARGNELLNGGATGVTYKTIAGGLNRMLQYYQEGCDYGDPDGCANLAICYTSNAVSLGLPRNEILARQYNQKACESGATAYCVAPANATIQTQAATIESRSATQDNAQDESDRQGKISQLQSDIQSREQDAQNNENNANQVLNNCSGPGAALCQALGQAGAARMRQKAAQDRNQADADREEIQRLEGQQVEAGQRRDASYGGNLAQVAQHSPTIQQTAAQQQANLQAMAAAKQQQQAQEQARLATQQNSRVAQTVTATASQQPSTPQQTVSAQPSCTNMTGSVQGSVTVGSDGWVSGHLTNNSATTLYVFYTFKKDGVPSNLMSNAGATTIGPGQTVGGEGQGLYSTNADKDQARIYWYAVLKSDTDAGKQCVHTW